MPSDSTTNGNEGAGGEKRGYDAMTATMNQGKEEITVDLNAVPVKVQKVKFDGLARTKTDFVHSAIKDVFRAKNFGELISRVGDAQRKLRHLEVFSEIGTLVDTSKAKNATTEDYEVTFLLKEARRLKGGIRTMMGANEVTLNLGIQAPNLMGRGEKLTFDHNLSTIYDRTSEIGFSKPFPNINVASKIDTSLFYKRTPHTSSGFNISSLGTSLGFNTQLPYNNDFLVQWYGAWREISSMGLPSRPISMDVREHYGHSVKSSLRFIFSSDQRDQIVFPTAGTYRKFYLELAGLFGDAKYAKGEVEYQYNLGFPKGISVQASLRGGLLQPLSSAVTACNIADHFFLGGPQTLRGFQMRGVGPRTKNDSLGGKVYISTAFHIFAPLPFISAKLPFADSLRLHGLVNMGTIGNNLKDEELKTLRVAYGLGLAVRLVNKVRVEINYLFPVNYKNSDATVKGLQFGVGVEFL